VRLITKAALTFASMLGMATTVVAAAAGPASATTYPPPSIHLQCAAADGDAQHGSVCALPPGMTTAPDNYSTTIAVSKGGAAGPTVTFAVTAGSLPPGLSLTAQSTGSGTVISGNPTVAGTFDFTIKATDANLTSSLAYQITVTVQGPPDQLVCAAANGSFLISGVCVLPDSVAGQAYQGHLPTSHNAGGTLSVTGSLPPGLSLPATFGDSGALISGTATQADTGNTYSFTAQGSGDQGQPLYRAYQLTVDANQPLAIVPPAVGTTLSPGMVGGAYAQNFFLSGGSAPYTWAVASGQLPPGLTLQNFGNPRDADNELTGTPTTAGTYAFTMRLTDFAGQQTTQQFSLTIDPPLAISSTPMASGTVGVPYSHDLNAQGGDAPYSWFVVNNINELPPGLTLGSSAPDFNNVLTGTPTQAGTFSLAMQVQDSQDNTVTGTVTVTINP